MLKKIVGLVLLIAACAAPAATAQQYPPVDDSIVSPTGTTYTAGAPATFIAKTFRPFSPVTFRFFSDPVTLGTVTANSAGIATITTSIPAAADPGRHTVQASGIDPDGAPLSVELAVTVLGAKKLARTGASNSTDLTRVGIAAVAAGGLLVLASKKRRDRMAAAIGSDG